jgi:hypothetical protein
MLGRGQRRGRRMLPPCHFSQPVDDMGTLRIQLACPMGGSPSFPSDDWSFASLHIFLP